MNSVCQHTWICASSSSRARTIREEWQACPLSRSTRGGYRILNTLKWAAPRRHDETQYGNKRRALGLRKKNWCASMCWSNAEKGWDILLDPCTSCTITIQRGARCRWDGQKDYKEDWHPETPTFTKDYLENQLYGEQRTDSTIIRTAKAGHRAEVRMWTGPMCFMRVFSHIRCKCYSKRHMRHKSAHVLVGHWLVWRLPVFLRACPANDEIFFSKVFDEQQTIIKEYWKI